MLHTGVTVVADLLEFETDNGPLGVARIEAVAEQNFELHGGKDAGRHFIDSLELLYHVANIGDARSLAIHPASTTHSQMDDAQQRSAGLQPELIRLSIGIEHIDDITADLKTALG